MNFKRESITALSAKLKISTITAREVKKNLKIGIGYFLWPYEILEWNIYMYILEVSAWSIWRGMPHIHTWRQTFRLRRLNEWSEVVDRFKTFDSGPGGLGQRIRRRSTRLHRVVKFWGAITRHAKRQALDRFDDRSIDRSELYTSDQACWTLPRLRLYERSLYRFASS